MSSIIRIILIVFFTITATLSYASERADKCLANPRNNPGNGFQLLLYDCGLEDSDMRTIVRFLQAHPNFQYVDMSGNAVTDNGIKELVTVKSLHYLYVDDTKLTDQGINLIATMSLKWLSALGLQLNATSAKAIANINTLQLLFLDKNNIGDEGATYLAKNSSIGSMTLDNDNIGDNGAIALAKNKQVGWLELNNNHISDQGAIALAANTKIDHLMLNHNQITDTGALALAQSKSIQILEIKHNALTDAGKKALKARYGANVCVNDDECKTPEPPHTALLKK